ncbi:MAG: DUF1684 domain-containing protein [Acidobacteria bacterium]|nr:DUF1684 domain-containing protein [Acidobacteriota bacterium]
MKNTILALYFLVAVFGLSCEKTDSNKPLTETPAAYEARIKAWHTEYEKGLLADDGWLSLAGLVWLEEGENSIGTGKDFDVALPDRLAPGKFGTLSLKKGSVHLKVEKGIEAAASGRSITEIDLLPDTSGDPTVVKSGDIEFLLIKRNEKFGIRIRDKKNPSRVNFKGLDWFPIDRKYELTADFEPFEIDRDMPVPNVLGQTVQMKSPGMLRFKIDGKEYRLQPALNGDGRLFIIFRDLSSKKTTYGAGRFIYTKMPENGKLVLDFNKAENPPCAYTEFATCPLPPSQNELAVELSVGEKNFKPQ